MAETEVFSLIDHQVGSFLGSGDDDLELFYSYLAASFRQGSLFVEYNDGILLPKLEEAKDSHEALLRGYCKLQESPYVVRRGNRLFLETAYKMLSEIDRLVKKIREVPPSLVLDEARLQVALDAEKALLPEQSLAIMEAAKNSLSCIWGGPGTGKTYTAGWLVRLFLEQHPKARIVLTAPTGKAASNLRESIQRQIGPNSFQAKTLHALLGLKRVQTRDNRERLSLPYDLIIVDESSMIDARLAQKLLSQVPVGLRIIFLGDPFQLPPIEAGEPFVAFVEQAKAGKLITTKRQENRAIIDLADNVKAGNIDEALACFSSEILTFRPLKENFFDAHAYVKQLYKEPNMTVEAFFRALLGTRLLSPLRDGPFGTEGLNATLLQLARDASMQPIIITKNDYNLNLSNGQVGVLSGKTAFFENFEDPSSLRPIPQVLLSSYETAYCLSVHKSQGSEFGEVVLFLPEGSESFGRNMLYTAITRAKKKLTIYSSEETLRACITTPSRRPTTILPLP